MRDLYKAFSKSGGGSILTIFFGLITVKIIALSSGPAGVGLFSLLRQLQQTLVNFTTLQGNTALVQGINGPYKENKEHYLTTVASILLIVSVSVCFLVWYLSPFLSKMVLGQAPQGGWLIKGLIPSLFFLTGFIYLGALLNGYRAIGRLALAQSLSAAFGAVIVYPLLVFTEYPWGLLFLLLGINGFGFLLCLLFANQVGCLTPLLRNWKYYWDNQYARYFLKFSGVTLVTGFMSTGTLLVVRTMFVHHGGVVEAGVFDAAWTISSAYLMIILSSVGTYYMPMLSSLNEIRQRATLIVQVLRIMVLLGVPIITLMILGKGTIVSLLYTREFMPALDIIQWMLIGDYFKIVSWVLATPMVAFAHLRIFFLVELLWNTGMIAGTWVALFFFDQVWLVGVVFILFYIIYSVLCYTYSRSKHGFQLSIAELKMCIFGLILVVCSSLFTWNERHVNWWAVPLFATIVAGFVWTYTKEERRKLSMHIRGVYGSVSA